MKPIINENGVQVETFTEIFERLTTGLKDIYGQDINLDQNSPDGQRVGIFAKEILDLQSFAQYIFTQFDPDTAIGVFLNIIIKLNGITRRPSSRSQVDLTIITDRPVTLPTDYTVQDELDQKWTIDNSIELQSGTNTVTFHAEIFGAIEASANTINTPLLIIEGIQSVNNQNQASVGLNEETDVELRQRRKKTFENAAYSTIGGLNSKLISLPNVTDAIVYENDTDQYDSDRQMSAHSIWCVVDGGDVNQIIETIVKNKTAGAGDKGDVSGTYTESILRNDGSTLLIPRTRRFDRLETVQLYVTLTVKRKVINSPPDLEMIKKIIASNTFYINGFCEASDLYCGLNDAGNNFIAYDMKISRDNETFTVEALQAGYDERFNITVDNITINEIVTR